MTVQTITAQEAKRLVTSGAILADIREADEHARERIPGAVHAPLSSLEETTFPIDRVVVFHCRSGARTQANAERLASAAPGGTAFVVEGGLDAWKKAGLPSEQNRSQPIEMMRQVQIAAGGLAAVGSLAALFGSPWFAAVPLFVGSGLVFAGVTGTCGMAALLKRAPWNARTSRAATN